MDSSQNESVPDYLDRNIFPILLNAMEEMLLEAYQRDALKKIVIVYSYRQGKCFFNALDCLAEILWNRNPHHSSRSRTWIDVFSIPEFKLWLRSNPRPIYPKSWLWTKEEAVLRIQRYVRGWFVRKRIDVQEMRQFWKVINVEKTKFFGSEAKCTSNKTVY